MELTSAGKPSAANQIAYWGLEISCILLIIDLAVTAGMHLAGYQEFYREILTSSEPLPFPDHLPWMITLGQVTLCFLIAVPGTRKTALICNCAFQGSLLLYYYMGMPHFFKQLSAGWSSHNYLCYERNCIYYILHIALCLLAIGHTYLFKKGPTVK